MNEEEMVLNKTKRKKQGLEEALLSIQELKIKVGQLEKRVQFLEIGQEKSLQHEQKFKAWKRISQKSKMITSACLTKTKTTGFVLLTVFLKYTVKFISLAKRIFQVLTLRFGYIKVAGGVLSILIMMGLLIWGPWKKDNQTHSKNSQKQITRVFSKKSYYKKHPRAYTTRNSRWQKTKQANSKFLSSVSKWINASHHGAMDSRLTAIQKLANIGTKPAAWQLIKLLNDPNEGIKFAAIRGLSKIKGYRPSAIALAKLVKKTSEPIGNRKEAVLALGTIGSTKEIPLLLKIAKNTRLDEDFRYNAITGLGMIGDAGIAPSLIAFLKDSSPVVRESAAATLGAFGYPNAIKSLIYTMQEDTEIDVRVAAIQALGKIRSRVQKIAKALLNQWVIEKEGTIKQEIKNALKELPELSLSASLKKKIASIIN